MRLGSSLIAMVMALCLMATPVFAGHGISHGAASFILPTTGQAMNGQLGNAKTKIMGGLEAALVTTTAILGGAVGGAIIWVALGPLIANHIWSAVDAYYHATPEMTAQVEQLEDAQRILRESQRRNRARQENSFFDEPVIY